MKERPILFKADMVRAILEGRKSQTRRVVKDQPCPAALLSRDAFAPSGYAFVHDLYDDQLLTCPYGVPGDRLWVREATTYWERPDQDETPRRNESNRPKDGKRYERWMNRVMGHGLPGEDFLVYKADGFRRSLSEWQHPHPIYDHCVGRFGKTVSPIHMPRWASRITLEVTGVRVERLQDISEEDAVAEGITQEQAMAFADEGSPDAYLAYMELWNSINGPDSWDSNPWVWVVEFVKL